MLAPETYPPPVSNTGKLATCSLFHVVEGVGVFSVVHRMLDPEGIAGIDAALKAGALAGSATLALCMLSATGLNYVPRMRTNWRGGAMALIGATYLSFASIAALGTASIITRPAGELEWRSGALSEMRTWSASAKDVLTRSDAITGTLDNCFEDFSDQLDREVSSGAISRDGGAVGPVSAEIASIRQACASGRDVLLANRDAATTILVRADRLIDRAARAAADPGVKPAAKMVALTEAGATLQKLAKGFGQALPLAVLDPTRAILEKNRAAIKLSPWAVAALRAASAPVAAELAADQVQLDRDFLEQGFTPLEPIHDPITLLGQAGGSAIWGWVFALICSVPPALILLLSWMNLPSRREGGDPLARVIALDRATRRAEG